jgi:hypothetical protein
MPTYVTLIKRTDAWVSASRFVAVCGPSRFAIDARSRALGDGSRRFVCKLRLTKSGRTSSKSASTSRRENQLR